MLFMTSWRKSIIFIFVSLLIGHAALPVDISYFISSPEPHTHYIEVQILADKLEGDVTELQLPAWAPGSYKIRNFTGNIEGFKAINAKGKELDYTKVDKSTWSVNNGKHKSIEINYRVYAFEISVRTSFVDEHHCYINGSSAFMYVKDHKDLPVTLTIDPYEKWNTISTGLPKASSDHKYIARDYDHLADCPIEIGNHEVISFEASGVHHEIAMYSPGNYDASRLKEDMARLVESCTNVFGETPNDYYLFIVHNLDGGGGGLEHENSTTLQTNRWNYQPDSRYLGFLGLATHEYFHLWNVKRIRPEGYWNIDYTSESLIDALWFLEGITSYYDEILMKRTGYFNEDEYLRKLANTLTNVDNRPGDKVQPVSEASRDAWFKFYQQNENSWNTTVSYYTKGSMLGAILDLMIIESTKGEKSLNDVMRILYQNYYKDSKEGINSEDIKSVIESVSGKKMDGFFSRYIYGTEPLNYEKYLHYAGLEIFDLNEGRKLPFLGVGTRYTNGKLMVTSVTPGSSAFNAGINVNDEIIAMNGFRIKDNLSDMIARVYQPDESIQFLLSRNGLILEKEIVLGFSERVNYRIHMSTEPDQLQKTVRKKWLTGR